MPRIRSDDGPRKLRAVWLGPRGTSLPFEWTYVQWLVCLALANVFGLVLFLVIGALAAPVYGIAAGIMYGVPAGFYAGVKVMKNVSYDEPIRYRVSMFLDQLRTHGEVVTEDAVTWEIYWPKIGDLGPGARRAVGWEPDHTVSAPLGTGWPLLGYARPLNDSSTTKDSTTNDDLFRPGDLR